MIISASRRTDIPAFYADWFFNRLKEGFVHVRNPFNPGKISEISLLPKDVEGIVFWTKDVSPMIERLHLLESIPYYFQFTLNPYGTDIERSVASKDKNIIPSFRRLADIIGSERVLWRYDPIIITDKYSVDYHIEYFEKLARRLAGHTKICTFSFLDIYHNTLKHMAGIDPKLITNDILHIIAASFSEIAKFYGIELRTCAEEIDLESYGISHARCIDDRIFTSITDERYCFRKDSNQRKECGCMESVDIGAYDTCMHACSYCYATHSLAKPAVNHSLHDPHSTLLTGEITQGDTVVKRVCKSVIVSQTKMNI